MGIRPEECFFWATYAGTELDLLVVRRSTSATSTTARVTSDECRITSCGSRVTECEAQTCNAQPDTRNICRRALPFMAPNIAGRHAADKCMYMCFGGHMYV